MPRLISSAELEVKDDNQLATTLENKIAILSDLWISYRNDSQFEDFISYNDLGLPLAYLIEVGIVQITDRAKGFIEETFEGLLAEFQKEDTGFSSMGDLFGIDYE